MSSKQRILTGNSRTKEMIINLLFRKIWPSFYFQILKESQAMPTGPPCVDTNFSSQSHFHQSP